MWLRPHKGERIPIRDGGLGEGLNVPLSHGIVSQRQNALCRCRTFVTSIIQDGKLTLPREKIYGPTGEQVCDAEYQYV